MNQQETDLYRHYDAAKNLLYVGISLNTAQRLCQHMRDSKWASEISSIEVERFPSRQDALNAEKDAIKTEKPLWNVIHNRETKREKVACNTPTRKIPKKASRPKPQKPSDPFNMESMEAAIDYTIIKMGHLRMLSLGVTCTEDADTSTFVKITIDLPGTVRDDDVQLNEFISLASFSPYPMAHIAMMTGYTRIDERDVNKSTKISLITPGWLRRMLYGDFDLSKRERREVLDGIDRLLVRYEKAFFEFLSIERPGAVLSPGEVSRHVLTDTATEFDLQNLRLALNATIRGLSALSLSADSVGCEFDADTGFEDLVFTSEENHQSQKKNLEDIFNLPGAEPYHKRGFRLVGGYTSPYSAGGDCQFSVSVMTPGGLKRHLFDILEIKKHEPENVIAEIEREIENYRRGFDSVLKDESVERITEAA